MNIKVVLIGLAILLAVGVFGYVYCQSTVNSAITQEEQIKAAKASVDASMKERHDSIIQMVQVVERAASHVEKIMGDIAEARKQANAGNDAAAMMAINVIMEQYPDIKANENFINLQNKIASSEQQILRRRENYNAQVREYNRLIRTFPRKQILSFMEYTPIEADFLKFDEEDLKPVTNMFSNK